MGDQDINFLRKHLLSTVCDHQHPATATENSAKRFRSELHPPLSNSTAADQDLHGFKKVSLQEKFTAASSLPLHRTLSEPIPVFNQQALALSGTPPRPPARSPRCGESPSSKRLKRMKERLREMSQWWSQVIEEDDDGAFESENYCTDKEEYPSREAVLVERSGECPVLHFKCPCGNGYQILLSGSDCYYKLTTFPN